MSTLPVTVYLSFAGALLALLGGARSAAVARGIALATSAAGLALTLFATVCFTPSSDGLQTLVDVAWIPDLGLDIRYHFAVDGISLTLALLTGLAATAGVLFSWNVTERPGQFFALYLVLLGGVYGVFFSADAFLLFVFYEIAIVPKYFLIAIWGSTRREYGAMKLVLYSFASSAGVDRATVGLRRRGRAGFRAKRSRGSDVSLTGGYTGHLVRSRLLWLRRARGFISLSHVGAHWPRGRTHRGFDAARGRRHEARCLRLSARRAATFPRWLLAHMGFVLLGLAAATPRALAGAVLQMFSHGIIAGLLFAVVGRIVYERFRTRQLDALRALPLHRMMPFAATVFVLAGLASMGMPGFSGFPAELTILIGTWQTAPLWAVFAAVGIVVSAAFTLRAIQQSFFGRTAMSAEPTAPSAIAAVDPLTWPEYTGALLLLATTLYIGLNPDALLDLIIPALQGPLMQAALRGGTP